VPEWPDLPNSVLMKSWLVIKADVSRGCIPRNIRPYRIRDELIQAL